jgi:hypothetical protein
MGTAGEEQVVMLVADVVVVAEEEITPDATTTVHLPQRNGTFRRLM